MRAVAIAVALALVLSFVGSLAVLVAGDVGPGDRPVAVLFQVAGDIGPGDLPGVP